MPFRTQRTLPPNLTPTGKRCIQITIPDDDEWERDLYSQLTELAIWQFWERDAGKNATKVARKWRKALKTFTHVDCNPVVQVPLDGEIDVSQLCDIIRYHQGKLQVFCCDAWQDVPTDGTAPVPGEGGQPNTTSDPGPGQSSCNNVQLDALQSWLVPHPVNTGDVLEVTNLDGAWTAELTQWTYADGVPYVFGRRLGSPYFIPVDPAPTINHGKLCYVINGVYYAASDGPFTVPAGVSNAQCTLTGNLSDINPSGTITFSMCLTNGEAPPATEWCAYLDFTLSDFDFTDTSGIPSVWTPGVGWVAVPSHSLDVRFIITTACEITYLKYWYHVEGSLSGCDANAQAAPLFIGVNPVTPDTATQTIDGTGSAVNPAYIRMVNTGCGGETVNIAVALEVHGTGDNPFIFSNC